MRILRLRVLKLRLTPPWPSNGAGILFAVQAPDEAVRALTAPGTLVIGTMNATADAALLPALAAAKIDAVGLEMLPRITRAQSMDILSSQANLAGYRAGIEAADAFPRGFPMMMTLPAPVPPARCIGDRCRRAAGLQAHCHGAPSKRHCPPVRDVRPAAKKRRSKPWCHPISAWMTRNPPSRHGPYAGQMSEEFRKKQADLMTATIAKNDIVICTALMQGRRAPVIVTSEMVAGMKSGSIIIDLAADSGGNCAATVPGETITTPNGVTIIGHRNWPSRIAVAASQLYAHAICLPSSLHLLGQGSDAQAPKLTETDDLIKGALLTRSGEIVHPNFKPAA